jgi:hypothetical protein
MDVEVWTTEEWLSAKDIAGALTGGKRKVTYYVRSVTVRNRTTDEVIDWWGTTPKPHWLDELTRDFASTQRSREEHGLSLHGYLNDLIMLNGKAREALERDMSREEREELNALKHQILDATLQAVRTYSEDGDSATNVSTTSPEND